MATRTVTLVRMNRWIVLAGYGVLAACSQLLWLSYAPITTQTHRVMGVSVGAAGDLAAIFPLMYVILALPSGRWLDARFERALSTGAMLTAGGGLLRLANPSSYGWALAGQFVAAAGQPLVLNSITKVAARYFPPEERTTAISVGSAALYVGILAAVLSGGPLFDAGGLPADALVQSAVAVVAAVWVLFAVRTPTPFHGDPSVAVSLGWLRADRFMWVLGGLLFVGMGVFNAVATWLDSILGHFGRGGAAGYLIAIMTVAGILGAAVVPQAVAKRDQRRALLQTTVSVTIVAFARDRCPAQRGLHRRRAVRGGVRSAGRASGRAGLVGTSRGARARRRRGRVLAACGEPRRRRPGADRPGPYRLTRTCRSVRSRQLRWQESRWPPGFPHESRAAPTKGGRDDRSS